MADKKKLKIVAVKGTGTDRKVVLWERHPDHPEEGEAFVCNDEIVREVAETPAVKRLIAEGLLKEASLSENETARVNWNSGLEEKEEKPKNKGGRPAKNPVFEPSFPDLPDIEDK